jgi:hypothetical protein
MLAVSRSYLERVLAHQLALSVERGVAAPLGLLQVAETLGGVDWQPARMDFGETLARLIAEIPRRCVEARRSKLCCARGVPIAGGHHR